MPRSLLAAALLISGVAVAGDLGDEAQRFLDLYNSLYQGQSTASNEGYWKVSTDVNDYNEGFSTGAATSYAAFVGDPRIIEETRRFLAVPQELTPLQVRQLEAIRLEAASRPGTIPDVVRALVAQESRALAALDGYVFCLTPLDDQGRCPEPKTANDLDDALRDSRDLQERAAVWTASKEIGRTLKPELLELVRLRNQVAREMGYSSYFALQVADYGMSVPEMMGLLDDMVTEIDPLYRQLHAWAGAQLAARYQAPRPKGPLPAHWLPNRWGQEWTGLVPAADLNPYFQGWTAERIVKQAEQLYVSMGFQPLPEVFWQRSDLYPVPAGQSRLKNAHASAWDMDLEGDVRSLMSVQPDSGWFFTAHHELGHIYYYLSYDRPEVPAVLREGANRGFHEAIGELIALAAGQPAYLRQQGILPRGAKLDASQALLVDALERTVVFVPWSAGVMTHFEYELYEKDLPPDQWQRRWWELVERYQGITPPSDRLSDPDLCDACTKTHIIDDPASYYDYAVATVVMHQLHDHICRQIIGVDPHECNYYGRKDVGDFLKSILEPGATEDWRALLERATGQPLSTRAMMDYYRPLSRKLR